MASTPKDKRPPSQRPKRLVATGQYRPSQTAPDSSPPKSALSKRQDASKRRIPSDKKILSIGDHLEELRWRLIAILAIFLILSMAAFFFSQSIHDLLVAPYRSLVGRELLLLNAYGGLQVLLKLSFMVGLTVSLPICAYLLWGFVAPALSRSMALLGHGTVLFSVLLFWLGSGIAWRFIFPLSLQFLFIEILPGGVAPQISVEKYYSFLFLILIGSGLVFQLPLLTVVLGALEIVPFEWHLRRWKYVLLIIFGFAALITPPDPASQLILAALLFCLYLFSILIVWTISRKSARKSARKGARKSGGKSNSL